MATPGEPVRYGVPGPRTAYLDRYTVDTDTHCWIWSACVERDGYGRVWSGEEGRNVQAHRFIYELLQGPIPEGMELDHLCRDKTCVNPGHLEPVTTAENQRRGDASKLTWDDVRFIRAFYSPRDPEFGQRALGRMFGVSHEAIRRVVEKTAWVDDPAVEGGQ